MKEQERRKNLDFVAQMRARRPVPDPTFAATLRRDLLTRMTSDNRGAVGRNRRRRYAIAVLATGIVLVLTMLLVSPPLRSWAQETAENILQFLHITHTPTPVERAWEHFALDELPEPVTDQPDVKDVASYLNVQIDPTPLSIEEAQAAVDFRLRLPTYLPYDSTFFGAFVREDQVGDTAARQVQIHYYYEHASRPAFHLTQGPVSGSVDVPVGGGTAREVTVNGQPAVAVEGAVQGMIVSSSSKEGAVSSAQKLTSSGLLWEENGIAYQLWSYDFSVETLIRIADSLE